MSTETFIQLLQETFGKKSDFNMDQLKRIAEETVVFFQEMKRKVQSGDSALIQEAIQTSLEVKQVLEKQMVHLEETHQIDPSQIDASLSPEERKWIEDLKGDLNELSPHNKNEPAKAPKLRIKQ